RRALPERELARRPIQYEQPKLDDEAGVLRHRDEFTRRQAAELWMIPAQERLEARDRTVFQPHHRLVEHGHLAALERTAQVGLERQAVALARAHRGLENLDPVAANALAVVHRKL